MEKLIYYLNPPEFIDTMFGRMAFTSKKKWYKTINVLFRQLIKDAEDRKLYGNTLFEVLNEKNIDLLNKRVPLFLMNPSNKVIMENLSNYMRHSKVILFPNKVINCYYDSNIDFDKIKYIDGLYENEIMLINEHYTK